MNKDNYIQEGQTECLSLDHLQLSVIREMAAKDLMQKMKRPAGEADREGAAVDLSIINRIQFLMDCPPFYDLETFIKNVSEDWKEIRFGE